VRIDKWLWTVRIFKTRSVAAEALKLTRVTIGGAWVKPSHEVRVGDVVSIRKGAITLSFKVLEISNNRLPASEVPRFAENVTPQSELDKLLVPREMVFVSRDRGTGRPTKKDRRDIDSLIDSLHDF
jgi:ribosome-associated heat shock protein Hsp15